MVDDTEIQLPDIQVFEGLLADKNLTSIIKNSMEKIDYFTTFCCKYWIMPMSHLK